jgi:hypothetical protein
MRSEAAVEPIRFDLLRSRFAHRVCSLCHSNRFATCSACPSSPRRKSSVPARSTRGCSRTRPPPNRESGAALNVKRRHFVLFCWKPCRVGEKSRLRPLKAKTK